MDNLVLNCTDALDQPVKPACPTDYGSRVVGIALMKKGGTFTVASSDYPTKSEFDAGITSGAITFIGGISNGTRTSQGGTTISGDDTVSGGSELRDEVYRIAGKIQYVNEAISRATEKYTRYPELKAWYFTDKNYVFGGPTGYTCSVHFGLKAQEGISKPVYIPFELDFIATGTDPAGYDADFDALVNS